MILKSSIRGNGPQFARYLLDNAKNEQARVVEIRGTASPDNLHDSLTEISAYERLTRSEKGIWQVVISPTPGEDMTMSDADWKLCMDEIEKTQAGFEGQPRGLVEHVCEGRKHAHAWWSRYDAETETMLDIDHSALNLRAARLEIEKKLDHEHLLTWQEKQREREAQREREEAEYETLLREQAEKQRAETLYEENLRNIREKIARQDRDRAKQHGQEHTH